VPGVPDARWLPMVYHCWPAAGKRLRAIQEISLRQRASSAHRVSRSNRPIKVAISLGEMKSKNGNDAMRRSFPWIANRFHKWLILSRSERATLQGNFARPALLLLSD
jgi:hypothetical protein